MWRVGLAVAVAVSLAWITPASAQWFQRWENDGRRPFWEQEPPRQAYRDPSLDAYGSGRMALGGARPYIEPEAPKKVALENNYTPNSIIIDTAARKLFLILSDSEAYEYPISVGRQGFSWTGTEFISRVAEWPDWHPPKEMIARDRRLPDKMTGGLRNPLGARALYLGKSLYRIHGTNDAKSIGRAASSGCFRMMNEHVVHLASQIVVGTPVTVVKRLPPVEERISPPPPLPQRNAVWGRSASLTNPMR
jgi:lipoprotein-anchoring transpeptidase ErfK/SrfK